jgi:hypothetical protein
MEVAYASGSQIKFPWPTWILFNRRKKIFQEIMMGMGGPGPGLRHGPTCFK